MDNLSVTNPVPGGVGGLEWAAPSTREEADVAILTLSNDIGLILAQLAEDQVAWCQRTGRSPADHAAWRRRALFAKVHKEGQLRECKRIRAQLSVSGDPTLSSDESHRLLLLVRQAIDVWIEAGEDSGSGQLDAALASLAECLGTLPRGSGSRDVRSTALTGNRGSVGAPQSADADVNRVGMSSRAG